MAQTTDAAMLTATRLAAELIIRRNELTARQIGIITHALGLPEADPLHTDDLRDFSSQAGTQTFGGAR